MLLKSLLRAAGAPSTVTHAHVTVAPAEPAPAPAAEPAAPARAGGLVRRAPTRRGGMFKSANGQPVVPAGFVSKILDAQDRIPEVARMGAHGDGLVHVSSLVDACARREVIASLYPAERLRGVHGSDRLVWAYGRAYEKHARDQFIKGWSGKVHGRWECRCGHRHFVGTKPAADYTCDRCRLPLHEYKEHPIASHDLGVIGNCDLPILLDDNWLMVGEFKSMEGEAWKKLEAPLGDHVLQAATYRKLYQMAGWKVHDTVAVIYGSKHYRFGSPYREFHVDGTSQSVQSAVGLLLEIAAEVKRHREAGTLPRRPCKSATITRAKQCAVCAECWNL